MYAETTIQKHHAGFGMYERHPNAPDDLYEDVDDLLDEMRQGVWDIGAELYELGVDELPEGVEDIRGLIYNEPMRVFACHFPNADREPGQHRIEYVGIVKVEEQHD